MLRNPRVLQTRFSHFRCPKLAPPLLHHHHGLQNPSIPAALIHPPFGKRFGLARHSSSKVVKPSESDNVIKDDMKLHFISPVIDVKASSKVFKPFQSRTEIGNGMRAYVTRLVERDCPIVDVKAFVDTIGPYGHQGYWTARSALVMRYVTPHDGCYEEETSRGGLVSVPEIGVDWELYSIVVQSPLLRRVLQFVFKSGSDNVPTYCSINVSSEHLELKAPFKPHLKERLEDALRNEQDPETKQHLSLFCNILEGNSSNEKMKENAANGIVHFEDLPQIFKPGAIVFTMIEGRPQLVSLCDSHDCKDPRYVSPDINYIDWRGTEFGREDVHTDGFTLWKFEGPMRITDLPLYPLTFHPFKGQVEQYLISRGKKFEALKGYHYCAYKGNVVHEIDDVGTTIDPEEDDWDGMGWVDSRVIIDTEAFYKLHPDSMQRTKRFKFSPDEDWINEDEMKLRLDRCAAKSLSQEELRLCPPTLRAYSVNDKKWLHVMVDDVKDIKWDDQAFKNLALPQEQKEMILSFANSQIRHGKNTENVVQGKDNGVIVLCGPPGAGQTLTAEAIAEELHAPLYTISAGNLGKTPEEFELFLMTTLEFAAKWKAVLLLDDATAFVKTRSYCDGQYKNLVPIYQRILEYYDSILFLNTNLSGDIDNAFESRVHLSSRYHKPATDTTQPEKPTEGDVEKLAQTPKPYGRVGDVFNKAKLLAMELKTPLSREHVRIVTRLQEADAGQD